jgi:hypothetical protein
MKHTLLITVILYLIINIIACKSENGNTENLNKTPEIQIQSDILIAGKEAVKIADSIMYIANVQNIDPEEAYYMDKWLGGAKIQVLAELIFNAVYDGKLKAYNYMSGNEMTIEDVKALDAQWNRKDIGQILFTEDWFFDSNSLKMYKQVNSVMLAYFRYNEDGELIGNQAGIRVYFNNTKPMLGAKEY